MAALLIGITLAVFWPVHDFEFVLWDDQVNVYENPHLTSVSPSNILHFWKGPYENLYIPLAYSVWASISYFSRRPTAENSEQRLDSRLFHLANVVFHLLSVLVVFAILRIVTESDVGALAGSTLFALHPIQVEPVAWVTGMKDVLCGLLSMVAVWQYLEYVKSKIQCHQKTAISRCVFATLAFMAALLTKPTAVVAPLLAWVLTTCTFRGKYSPSEFSRVHLCLLVWVIASVPLILLTQLSQATAVDFVTPVWARPLVAGDAITFYLSKLFMPVCLGIDYGRSPEAVLPHRWILATGLVPYGLAASLWLFRHRVPRVTATATVFAVTLLPVLGWVPFTFQDHSTVADRYLYLSMLGPALGLAWLCRPNVKGTRRAVVVVGCVLFLGGLTILSMSQVQHWRSNTSLFKHALEVNPRSSLSLNNLGLTLANHGKIEDAIGHFHKALNIRPDYPHALNNLGNALFRQGRTDEAITHYCKALLIKPDYAKAYNNLAIALAQKYNMADSIAYFQKALLIKPDFVGAHYNLANALKQQGRIEEAIAHFQKALLIRPDFADARYNLANALRQEGKTEEAIGHFQKALHIRPNDPEIHNNIGIAFAKLGNVTQAIAHFQRALLLKPDFKEAETNLSIAIAEQQESISIK
jgi:Flp pilus assembly protein TadD